MAAGTLNLVIEIGASYDRTLTLRDPAGALVNLTGCTAAADIRESSRDGAGVLCSLTSGNGRLVLGGSAGTIRLVLDEEATVAMEGSSTAVWDLFVRFDASTVWKIVRGTVTFEPRRTVVV